MCFDHVKRCLSLFMALAMVFSLVPLPTFAVETEPYDQEPAAQTDDNAAATEPSDNTAATETYDTTVTAEPDNAADTQTQAAEAAQVVSEPEKTDLPQQLQARIDAIVRQYGITAEMTDDEIMNAIIAVDGDTLYATMEEIDALEQEADQLTDEQLQSMNAEQLSLYSRFCTVLEKLTTPSPIAATVSVLDGAVTVTDTTGTGTVSNGTVTVTVTATAGSWDIFGKTASNTITITNASGGKGQLKFSYSVINHSEFSMNGTSNTRGSYEGTLEAGGTITISMSAQASRNSTKTATLTLNTFELKPISDSNVTVSVSSSDSTLGSTTVNGGASAEVAPEGTVTLTATANSGGTFLAWIDPTDSSVISTDATCTYTAVQNIALQALFIDANSPVYYGVGNTTLTETDDAYNSLDRDVEDVGYVLAGFKWDVDDPYKYSEVKPLYLYDNLKEALSKAESSASKGVVPLNSGMLPAGDYTIPSGVTLLIPFDSANTMYTTAPGFEYSANWNLGSCYRSLTLESGTNIIVNGAISLSTVAHSADGGEVTGKPCGDYSEIVMQQGSTITINSGGALYAWGFITGSGKVTAKSGAEVYENFQLADYRGGNQSSSMQNKVFAASQYYVQNIEVPLTLEEGATENCCTWVNLISYVYQDTLTTVPFVGSNGLFNITSGSITKSYDGTVDRWSVEFNGDVSISSIALNIGNSGTVNSAGFVLGINNNITLQINSGSKVTVGQDIALQPGCKLIIAEGATCKLGSGVSAYIYDAEEWGTYCYTSGGDKTFVPVPASPTKDYIRTDADLVDAFIQVDGTLDASEGYLYTTEGKANIHSTGTGVVKMNTCSSTVTSQFTQADTTYHDISITSACLLNGDGSGYVDTTKADYYYHAEHKRWVAGGHIFDSNGLCSCGVQAEAQIGSTYYLTLTEAISAATAGGTIKLLANVASASADKCVIINRNGKTANITPADGLYLCTSDAAYAITKGFTLRNAECCYDDEVILRMKFYIPDAYLQDDYTISLTKDSAWDGPVTTTYTMAQLRDAGPDDSGRYLAFAGVASGEMTRVVKTEILDASGKQVTIYDKAGKELGTAYDFTVKQYVAAALQQFTNEKQKAVANALAVYGGYSQQYFDVSTDNLAYNIEGITMPDLNSITANSISKAVTYDGSDAGIKIKSFEPYLDSATYLRLKFVLDAGESISNYTFKLTGPDVTDKPMTVSYEAKTGRYYVDICDISAAYLDNDYTVVATNTKTEKAHTVTASVMAWVKLAIQNNSNTNQVNMAKALYWYNQAANAYFPNS